MSKYIHKMKKPAVFCLSAALGCLIFALFLAEPFLYLTSYGVPSHDRVPSQSFCLTIDVSGSMAGDKMEEMKRAAKQFVERRLGSEGRRSSSNDTGALIIFSSVAKIVVPLTNSADELLAAIDKLTPYGDTNFEDAMVKTNVVLLPADKKYSVVIFFTDGAPTEGDPKIAVDIAHALRCEGTQVIAVATDDGDVDFLKSLTGDEELVVYAADGEIVAAFSEAEARIIPPSVTGGKGNPYLQSAGWSALLCLGIALFLVVAQNHNLRKPLLTARQLKVILIGSLIAGPAAGFIGEVSNQIIIQVCFSIPETPDIIEETISVANDFVAFGQMVGWTLLGTALAFGMTFFIPNLSRLKSILFGILGGFLGSVAFVVIGSGSLGGRLIGAFILGACIGLLVSIVELAFSKAWLLVMYDLRNITRVNLGCEIITVGSHHANTIVIPDAPAKTGEFRIINGNIYYEGVGIKRVLKPGERIKAGSAELLVCSKDSVFAVVKFYPMRKTRIPQ